jgi:polyisoprenoid-binding protein YceI
MRNLILLCLLFFSCLDTSFGQKYVSESSTTTFFSSALIEDITASNDKGKSVFDSDNGEIIFSIPIKGFQFRKSLMQEHFNEKYLESEKYPKSTFSGKVTGFSKGVSNNNATAEGTLEIHGVKRNIKVPGTLSFNGDKVHLESKFMVKLEDYDIEIPSLLFQNIAEEVEVTLIYDYKIHED